MPQIGDSYPLQITATWNSFNITVTVNGPADENGDRTVDIDWTGPNSGSVTDFVISARMLDETSVSAAARHFSAALQ